MTVAYQQTPNEICFTIFGEVCQQISDWEYSIDKMVFNEQLETGSFHGQYEVDDDILLVMQRAKSLGKVIPYYGVGGSRGASKYSLRRIDNNYIIEVENSTAKEFTEFRDDFSDKPVIGEYPKPNLSLTINGKELQNLRKWKHWDEDQADTSKYVYEFGQVSLGRLGYTIKVTEFQLDISIDATEYRDW